MDDKRLEQVNQEQAQQLDQVKNTYNDMISQNDSFYQDLINTSKEYAEKQTDIQNQATDLALNEIEQNKKYAEQDYNREQRGAYLDYQAQQKNQADRLRAMGLQNTGYSETTLSSMYSTYQNRVATARDSFNRSVDAYNQQAAQARLANSSALMDIAYKALQQQAEYALQGFQYKNQLTIDLLGKQQNIRNEYWNKYQDVQKQINTEKALAEEIRQYNQNYALNKKKTDANIAHTNAQTKLINAQISQAKNSSSGSSGSSGGNSTSSGITQSQIKQEGGNLQKATAGGQTFKAKDVAALAQYVGNNNLENDVMRYYDANNKVHYVLKNNSTGKYEDVTSDVLTYIEGKMQQDRGKQNEELNALGRASAPGYDQLEINKTKTVSGKNKNDTSGWSNYFTNGGKYTKTTTNTNKNGKNVELKTYTFENGTKIEAYYDTANKKWYITRLK